MDCQKEETLSYINQQRTVLDHKTLSHRITNLTGASITLLRVGNSKVEQNRVCCMQHPYIHSNRYKLYVLFLLAKTSLRFNIISKLNPKNSRLRGRALEIRNNTWVFIFHYEKTIVA